MLHLSNEQKKKESGTACRVDIEFEVLNRLDQLSVLKIYRPNLEDQAKNRYTDILPIDKCRCRLPDGGYINASYINNSRGIASYIASQAPKPGTINDFWKLVWAENVNMIVMLTRLMESSRRKAHRYWPDWSIKKESVYSTITVRTKKPVEEDGIISTPLILSYQGRKRTILHLQYQGWPDFGTPTEFDPLIRVFEIQRKFLEGQKIDNSRILSHCSAGVGRTGVYLAISNVLDGLRKSKSELIINVFGEVRSLRKQRCPGTVQKRPQYWFIYNFLKYIIENKKLDFNESPLENYKIQRK